MQLVATKDRRVFHQCWSLFRSVAAQRAIAVSFAAPYFVTSWFAALSFAALMAPVAASAQFGPAHAPAHLDCGAMDCAAVLPGAVRFDSVEGKPFVTGSNAAGEVLGWVVMSTDVVDIAAYSGKPLVTLVGLDTQGVITGARVIFHSEPILLVGIPVERLHEFTARYTGWRADARVVVGRSSTPGAIEVDSISGATVTALVQNRTILESARVVGAATGVIDAARLNAGHLVETDEIWSWARMMEEGVFGRLTVTRKQMGVASSDDVFVDLYFTIADAPQVGRSLLGEHVYTLLKGRLRPGEHLFVVLGMGSESFKGSAFVRGGIFDRVRIDQGLVELVFRDTDYTNLSPIATADAPAFREGAVFISRGAKIDPGAPFDLVFLGSRYDRRTAFSREFREFRATHSLPASVYHVDEVASEAVWVQAWRNHLVDLVLLLVYLALVAGVFVFRNRTTASHKLLDRLHLASMIVGLGLVGFYMRAQPSVTQILTLIDSIMHEWRFDLFASEPLIFVLWIFIVGTSLYWGRGVFCGWICPYGALSELLHKVALRFGWKSKELPDRWHRIARNLRYVALVGLIATFLYSSVLGEKLAEIEPFKSTFLVPIWTRHWGFIVWWVVLLAASFVTYRPFCRYLCPLGGGLAILNSFRFAGPKRRKFCSSCKICARECEPRAFRADGTIDARECLSCMECEATYNDPEKCPPLIGIDRLLRKGVVTDAAKARLAELEAAKERV